MHLASKNVALIFLFFPFLSSTAVIQQRQLELEDLPDLDELLSSVDDLLKFTPSDFGLTGDPTDFGLPKITKLNPNFTTYTGPKVSDIVSSFSEFTRTRQITEGQPTPTFSFVPQTIPPPPPETETSTSTESSSTSTESSSTSTESSSTSTESSSTSTESSTSTSTSISTTTEDLATITVGPKTSSKTEEIEVETTVEDGETTTLRTTSRKATLVDDAATTSTAAAGSLAGPSIRDPSLFLTAIALCFGFVGVFLSMSFL